MIKQSGSWFSFGNDKLAQGREQVKQLMKENREIAKAVYKKVQEVLKEKRTVEDAQKDAHSARENFAPAEPISEVVI